MYIHTSSASLPTREEPSYTMSYHVGKQMVNVPFGDSLYNQSNGEFRDGLLLCLPHD